MNIVPEDVELLLLITLKNWLGLVTVRIKYMQLEIMRLVYILRSADKSIVKSRSRRRSGLDRKFLFVLL